MLYKKGEPLGYDKFRSISLLFIGYKFHVRIDLFIEYDEMYHNLDFCKLTAPYLSLKLNLIILRSPQHY